MKKSNLIFNADYTKYWEVSVNKSIDGTLIPGQYEALHFINKFAINRMEKVLDLGCSFGRMHGVLNTFSDHIYGIDPDLYAINRANQFEYDLLKIGNAESIPFESMFFDFVFCWAAFDVISHYSGLCEIHRVLKEKGLALITGKNHDYYECDSLAITAEKNAYAKGFPSKFTDLVALINNANNLGFKIKYLITFSKRGDFGHLRYTQEDPIAFSKNPSKCYEYLMVLEKINPSVNMASSELEYPFSKTALNLCLLDNKKSIAEFFLQSENNKL